MSYLAHWRPVLLSTYLALVLLGAVGRDQTAAQDVDFATAQQRVLERNLAGDFQGALQWAEKSLAIAVAKGGPNSADAASAYLSIAIQRQGLGELKVAEENYRKGLAIQQKLTIGRAEALRRAMLSLIDRGTPQERHPSRWAPFVVVGEGGAGR